VGNEKGGKEGRERGKGEKKLKPRISIYPPFAVEQSPSSDGFPLAERGEEREKRGEKGKGNAPTTLFRTGTPSASFTPAVAAGTASGRHGEGGKKEEGGGGKRLRGIGNDRLANAPSSAQNDLYIHIHRGPKALHKADEKEKKGKRKRGGRKEKPSLIT